MRPQASEARTSPPRDGIGAITRKSSGSNVVPRRAYAGLHGCLVHEKTPSPRTLQQACAQGHMVFLKGGWSSHERSTPVGSHAGAPQGFCSH